MTTTKDEDYQNNNFLRPIFVAAGYSPLALLDGLVIFDKSSKSISFVEILNVCLFALLIYFPNINHAHWLL